MIKMIKHWYNKYFSDPQVVVLILILLVGFFFILLFGKFLAPVIAAIVIAYLLDGLVTVLNKIKIPRLLSVLIVFILFLACLFSVFFILLPNLINEVMQLFQQLPQMIRRIQKEIILLLQKYPDIVSEKQVAQLSDYLVSLASEYGRKLVTFSLSSVKSFISVVVYLVLVPILVFFFLKDKFLILNWFKKYIPDNAGLVYQVFRDVNSQISKYVRGKLIEIVIVWICSFIVFSAMKLDYSILLSFLVGLSTIIPYIGAAVTYIPIMLVAFFQWGLTSQFVYIVIAYSIIQLIDGNVLAPLLLAGVVNIHPVGIIVAILIFGGIWGVWGLFFAIPLATLAHVVIKVWINNILDSEAKSV